jgi:hypothetical protein
LGRNRARNQIIFGIEAGLSDIPKNKLVAAATVRNATGAGLLQRDFATHSYGKLTFSATAP